MKQNKKAIYKKRFAIARKLRGLFPPNPFSGLSFWRADPNQKFEFRHGQIVEVYP